MSRLFRGWMLAGVGALIWGGVFTASPAANAADGVPVLRATSHKALPVQRVAQRRGLGFRNSRFHGYGHYNYGYSPYGGYGRNSAYFGPYSYYGYGGTYPYGGFGGYASPYYGAAPYYGGYYGNYPYYSGYGYGGHSMYGPHNSLQLGPMHFDWR